MQFHAITTAEFHFKMLIKPVRNVEIYERRKSTVHDRMQMGT